MNKSTKAKLMILLVIQICLFLAGAFLVAADFYHYYIMIGVELVLLGSNVFASWLASCAFVEDLDTYSLGEFASRFADYIDDHERITNVEMLLNHASWFGFSIMFWLAALCFQAIYMIGYVWTTKNFIVFFIFEAINIAIAKREVEVLRQYKELEEAVKFQ